MTAQNDVLYVESVPVFYWPTIATDLNDPSYFLRRATIRSDTVFGTEQIADGLGRLPVAGHQEQAEGHRPRPEPRLPERPRLGLRRHVQVRSARPVRHSGPTAGLIDYWGIQDHGIDNLGQGRGDVPPEASLPLSPLRPGPGNAALRLPTHRRAGLAQRPQLPARILQDRVGHVQESKPPTSSSRATTRTCPIASWPSTAWTTSSPTPIGFPAPTTSGSARTLVRRHVHLVRALQRGLRPVPAVDRAGEPDARRARSTICPGNSTTAGRSGGHAAGDRLALPARSGQGGALRDGRSGPMGRGPGRPAPDAAYGGRRASGPRCRCGASIRPSPTTC